MIRETLTPTLESTGNNDDDMTPKKKYKVIHNHNDDGDVNDDIDWRLRRQLAKKNIKTTREANVTI